MKVDMAQVLKYPLTFVPLSLNHVYGTMLSTPKSALLTYLETKGTMATPDEIDFQITDAVFFLHLHKDLQANFGGVAKYLLRKTLPSYEKVIHFASDKWITPSKTVKDKAGTQQI